MSKRESRLQRKLDKLTRAQDKIARLRDNIEIKDKYIRSTVRPELTKTPRSKSPHNYKKYYFSWCDTHSDIDGCWSWNEPRQWDQLEYMQIIKSHMDSYINNSWGEVEIADYSGKNKFRKLLNKYQPLDSLCYEAQSRWLNLDLLSQFEELFRFRLGTDRRIWGIRIDHHFYLVWYERQHLICPIDD